MYFEPGSSPFGAGEPVVLKIGGSLSRHPDRLIPVLEILQRARRPLVAVAGGGEFADAVREAQRRFGIPDRAAHRMAILAMHQNALAMASMAPSVVPLEKVGDVHAALARGGKAIWLPLAECEKDAELPETWDATSDAIAVRLAERLGGLPVVFLKSRAPKCSRRDPHSLAADQLIDPVSADSLIRSSLPFTTVEAGGLAHLEFLLAAREVVDAGGAA